MQSDRELLELAAKSAGFKWSTVFGCGRLPGGLVLMPQRVEWNPLLDDGDALRLAVNLQLLVDVRTGRVLVLDGAAIDIEERTAPDAMAATRRAIVRAAAKLGEGK